MIDNNRCPDQQGQEFTLTTKQVAERFGVSPELIRKLKSQHQDRLLEGTHWINFEGRTCWSEAALSEIEGIRNGNVTGNGSVTVTTDGATDAPTLESLAADFEAALRPHARKVAQQQIAQQFQRLVEEETRLEYQRLIEAANKDELAQYGFTDPLFVVGAIPAQRNGHKALAGVGDV